MQLTCRVLQPGRPGSAGILPAVATGQIRTLPPPGSLFSRLCYSERLRQGFFRTITRGGVRWLECRALARFSWLVHAFSTRYGGVSNGFARGLNLGFTESDSRAHVEENRRRFLRACRAEKFHLASLHQVHSTNIFQAARGSEGRVLYTPAGASTPLELAGELPVGDALITNQPLILLASRTADCLPILVADPRHRAIAALHAGWRGVLGRLAEKVVGVMRAAFHSEPQDLVAAIGPGIRECCYEVGDEVVAAFRGCFTDSDDFIRPTPAAGDLQAGTPPFPSLALDPPGHAPDKRPAAHLNLATAVFQQLSTAGIPARRIHDLGLCTSCRTDWFYSHRKEGSRTGRMMAIIGIRPN